MTGKTLIPFLALSFGLTWGIAAILILFYDQVAAIFGEITISNPLYILAVYAPGIAGVFLVWRHYRTRGSGQFLQAPDPVARPGELVAVPHPGHSRSRLHWRRNKRLPQRSISLFNLDQSCCQHWRSPCSSVPSRSSAGAALPCRFCSADSPRSGPA